MLRTLFIIFNFVGLLFINLFSNEVKIDINVPETVVAGQDFQVEFTLDKGQLESFSRLMQELPAGLTAKSVNTANSDFSFRDQKVRFIWLKMPESNVVKVSYTITVDERLKGTFDLGGKFSYIDNNERLSVDIPTKSISITPSTTVDQSLIVDIKDFKNLLHPNAGLGSMVFCIRQKPERDPASNSLLVNVLVNKDDKQKFAKIEETIPNGYTAVNVDSKEGIFTVEGNKIKILWMTMPTDPSFIITYKLVPSGKASANVAIKGTFSYLNEDKTMVRNIVEQNIRLRDLSKDQIASLGNLPADNTSQTTSTQPSGTDVAMVDNKNQTTEPISETVSPEETKKTGKVRNIMHVASEALTDLRSVERSNRSSMLEPENGVYFRVQLAAGKKTIDVKKYFAKFNLSVNQIRLEQHNGLNKYSIGSFKEYKEARDYRVHIWNTTPIGDAFVAAYSSGKRITVQEALMISNQKWYK
jgi:hypothetical protein